MKKDKRIKCIVFGCENYQGQGVFVGPICGPCYEHITTGVVGPTMSFLGGMKKEIERLDSKVKTIQNFLNGIK